jgi:hypothetical protein
VILDEAEALLDPVSDIEGFMLACLVDASTGMVLASRKDQDDISLPRAAAGGGGRMVMRTRRPGRLRRIAAARSTGMLPFSGRSDGSIYFRDGKVAFAESTRTPGRPRMTRRRRTSLRWTRSRPS